MKRNKTKKPKNRLVKGLLYSTMGLIASAGITVGGYLINQYPNENRYNIEKRIILPLLEAGHNIAYDKPLTDIDEIELNSFENYVTYKCFNKKTNENDLVFYKRGDNKQLDLDNISKRIKSSVLAVEDPYFKEMGDMGFFDELQVHGGVNWLSTTRAFYNTKIRNRTLQGGSTITQQVLKKTLDNDNVLDRSSRYDLKLEEILLSGKTEEKFGKDKVLETYINGVYLGNQISGIGAAIKNYFGLDDVNEASYKQALAISAAISNPNGILSRNNGVLYELSRGKETAELTPRQRSNLSTWIAKYNQGAKTLHETFGIIDKEKYNEIKIDRLKIEDFILDLQIREFDVTTRKEKTGDIANIITRHIVENDFVIDGNVVTGSYLINDFPGDVQITTAVDPEKNRMLKEELHSHLNSEVFKLGLNPVGVDRKELIENIHPSGVITNHKGHILAYYPSKKPTELDFLSYTQKSPNSIINTGSALKPIIMYFVNSIENKRVDEKFLPNKPVYRNKPRNWDGMNNPELKFSIEETLRQSINRPTAQAWMEYPRVRKAIYNMFDDYGLEVFKGQGIDDYSISLGADIEYPLLIPAFYGALLSDGQVNYPQLIIDIKANGKDVKYADETMLNLLDNKDYFPDKNTRNDILESLMPNSQVPLTPLKTGTNTNKEGNVTAGVSYLNQRKQDDYEGVNQFFVSFQKEKNLNNSQIGYSTRGSKIAFENVVERTNKIQTQRLLNEKFEEWKKNDERSESALVRSSMNALYNGIVDGKYGDFNRFYELKGALEQANMNSGNLITEQGYLDMGRSNEMLKQYKKELPTNNLIIKDIEKSKEK